MASRDAQVLPTKEASLFRQVVKYYETKQYKKALKAADSVLKKYPEHGETLAMKGLVINGIDASRKEESYELARRGIKHNLKSHITWHVYGCVPCRLQASRTQHCLRTCLPVRHQHGQPLSSLPGHADMRGPSNVSCSLIRGQPAIVSDACATIVS